MASKGRPPKPELPWYEDVAKFMVRENLGFSQAVQALGIKDIGGGKVEESIQNQKAFQKVLWRVRNTFYENIGGDISLTKNVVIGSLANCIRKMEEKGDYDKVATAAATLAKIAGWMGNEPTTTVFANLSQADLDMVKQKIRGLSDVQSGDRKPN